MNLGLVDRAALTVMRLGWLLQALVCSEILLPLLRGHCSWETELKLDTASTSGWVLFKEPEILPPEQLAKALLTGRFVLALIMFNLSRQVVALFLGSLR